MKLKPVTKIDKRNKLTSKKIGDDVMMAHCDVIVDDVMLARCDVIFIFPIYGQLRAIRKPDSGLRVCKTYIFVNDKLLSFI